MAGTESVNAGIAQSFNPFLFNQVREGVKERRAEKTEKKTFFSFIKEKTAIESIFIQKNETQTDNIENLLDDLHSSGDALKKNPRPDEIKIYKDAVRKFIRHVIENSFEIEERLGMKRSGKQKKWTNIEVIDKKLEKLAVDIISNQAEQIKILSSIDEITGLVVNLLE